MLKAVLYSDQLQNDARVDTALSRLMGEGRRIGYIPSGPDPDRRFFHDRETYYGRYGWELSVYYDLGAAQDPALRARLLACDAIHLSGGDTLAFLHRLKRARMLDVLQDWALAGGLMIGVSAGAMMMTPNIAADALFRAAEPVRVPEEDALNLLPFEFFPHAQDGKLFDRLVRYSRGSRRPVAACADGDGIVVSGGSIECIGSIRWLVGGAVSARVPASFADVEALSAA